MYQQPEYASRDDIIAIPTLIKNLPLPAGRLIGDLKDRGMLVLDVKGD